MFLFIVFALAFAWGWYRAVKLGGGWADRFRYALVHAIAITLAVFIAATLADWWGVFA